MNWGTLRVLTGLMFTATFVIATELPTMTFDRTQIRQDTERTLIAYGSLSQTSTIFSTTLPFKPVFVELVGEESSDNLAFSILASHTLHPDFLITTERDAATSEDGRYNFANLSSTAQLGMGASPVVVEGEVRIDNRRFAKLLLFPVSVAGGDSIVCNEEIAISIGLRSVAPSELLSEANIHEIQRATMERNGFTQSAGSESGQYVNGGQWP